MEAEGFITRRKLAFQTLPVYLVFLAIIAIFAGALYIENNPKFENFPALTGRVVDDAKILDAGIISLLENISQNIEQKTNAQLVVATISDLGGASIEEYGYQLGRAWGIGRKGYDDGVLLLIAPNDRAVRIEVGYGLEGVLTDAASSMIIEGDILPEFRAGNYAQGALAGATRIQAIITAPESAAFLPTQGSLEGEAQKPAPKSTMPLEQIIISIIVGFFSLIPLWGLGNFLATLIIPAYGAQLVPRPKPSKNGGWRNGGGWGGGSSGGGGFSGGGGSFGGGGSSGRW